jgi:hypothetical protein
MVGPDDHDGLGTTSGMEPGEPVCGHRSGVGIPRVWRDQAGGQRRVLLSFRKWAWTDLVGEGPLDLIAKLCGRPGVKLAGDGWGPDAGHLTHPSKPL